MSSLNRSKEGYVKRKIPSRIGIRVPSRSTLVWKTLPFLGMHLKIKQVLSRTLNSWKYGSTWLGSTKSKITKNKNGKNVPHLEITKIVLVYCNVVNNDFQQNSKVFYAFVFSNSFGQLLDFSPKNFILLKIFNSEFSELKIYWSKF